MENILEAWEAYKASKRRYAGYRHTPGVIYVLESGPGIYKIGRTWNTYWRMAAFRCTLPFRFTLIYSFTVADALRFEMVIHRTLRAGGKQLFGEWYRLNKPELEAILSIKEVF